MTSQRTSSALDRPVHHWTGRQREVLGLLARGRTNAQIAGDLGISLDGAKWHVREIMAELDAPTREDAAEYWRAYNGLPSRFGRLARALFGVSLLRGAAIAAGAVAAVGVAIAVMLIATGSGDDPSGSAGADSTQTPGVSVTVTGSATPMVNANDRRTGIPEVDNVIDLILAKDTAALLLLANTFPEKCSTTPPQRLGSLPLCAPGTPDGGEILTMRGMACERQTLDYLLETYLKPAAVTMYAVFRSPPGELFGYVPKGDYAIVFESGFPQRYEVRAGRLNGVWIGCGGGPEKLALMTADAGGVFIIPPAFALPTVTPTPAPDKDGYPDGWKSGVPGIDIVMQAIVSRNAPRIAAHFELSPVGCRTGPSGFPAPPFCKEGQAKGTPVGVLLVVGCEGTFQEASQLPQLSTQLADPGLRLFAVYERAPSQDPNEPPQGQYSVILNKPGSNGIELGVDGGQIVSIWFGCGANAAQLAARVPKASLVLPPP